MYLQKINLKNKYALVTGAGKGLGRACSIALAEAGATVIALSRTPSDLNKLEKDIKKIKGKVIKVPCDVMNYEELKTKLEKTIKAFKKSIIILLEKTFLLPGRLKVLCLIRCKRFFLAPLHNQCLLFLELVLHFAQPSK